MILPRSFYLPVISCHSNVIEMKIGFDWQKADSVYHPTSSLTVITDLDTTKDTTSPGMQIRRLAALHLGQIVKVTIMLRFVPAASFYWHFDRGGHSLIM